MDVNAISLKKKKGKEVLNVQPSFEIRRNARNIKKQKSTVDTEWNWRKLSFRKFIFSSKHFNWSLNDYKKKTFFLLVSYLLYITVFFHSLSTPLCHRYIFCIHKETFWMVCYFIYFVFSHTLHCLIRKFQKNRQNS